MEKPQKIINIPNTVTAAGLAASLWGIRNADSWAGVTAMMIGEASDGLDGFLARSLGQETKLGIMFDPVRDKIVGTAMLAEVSRRDLMPKSLALGIAGLEITKSLANIKAESDRRVRDVDEEPLKPTFAGKISSATLITSMIALLGSDFLDKSGHSEAAKTVKSLGKAGLAVHVISSTIAAAQYIKRAQ